MREIPVLYKRKEECCGCTACYAICPKEAISMVEDEEGFEKGNMGKWYSIAVINGQPESSLNATAAITENIR